MVQAAREHGFSSVENFNDTRIFYGQITALMARAKQLATMWYAPQLPAPPPVPQIAAPSAARPAYPALSYQPEERVEVVTFADMERVAVKRQ